MIPNDRQREKESMVEFIAKKREMFLVQMSLDTKREEIRKLEEKVRMKEEALRKSEQARSVAMSAGRDFRNTRLLISPCIRSVCPIPFTLFHYSPPILYVPHMSTINTTYQ